MDVPRCRSLRGRQACARSWCGGRRPRWSTVFRRLRTRGRGRSHFAYDRQKYEALHEQLGLAKPVLTDGFAVKDNDTLALDAVIDRRSVQRVVFRPRPGEEITLYEAETPWTEIAGSKEQISLRHPYDLSTRGRFPVEVEFVPFADIEQRFPQESRHVEATVDVVPLLGLALNLQETVRLHVEERIDEEEVRVNGQNFEIQGIAFTDGWLVALLRAEGAEEWVVQNYGQPVQLVNGQPFSVQFHLSDSAPKSGVYELRDLVVRMRDALTEGVQRVKRVDEIAPADAVVARVHKRFRATGGAVDAATSAAISIISPADGEVIEENPVEIEGKIAAGADGSPVVLVRPLSGKPRWWVQPPADINEQSGEFTALVYLGASSTDPGTKFQIVAVLVDENVLQGLPEGRTMRELPRGPRSEVITVGLP